MSIISRSSKAAAPRSPTWASIRPAPRWPSCSAVANCRTPARILAPDLPPRSQPPQRGRTQAVGPEAGQVEDGRDGGGRREAKEAAQAQPASLREVEGDLLVLLVGDQLPRQRLGGGLLPHGPLGRARQGGVP